MVVNNCLTKIFPVPQNIIRFNFKDNYHHDIVDPLMYAFFRAIDINVCCPP